MPPAAGVSLRPLGLGEASRLLAGERSADWHPEYPMTETLIGLQMLLAAHRAVGWPGLAVPAWWMHAIVTGGEVVGDVGFHGPPPADGPAVMELGYGVVPAARGRGVATAACGLLLAVAWRDGAAQVAAEADPDNLASQRVLVANGFRRDAEGRWTVRRPERRAG